MSRMCHLVSQGAGGRRLAAAAAGFAWSPWRRLRRAIFFWGPGRTVCGRQSTRGSQSMIKGSIQTWKRCHDFLYPILCPTRAILCSGPQSTGMLTMGRSTRPRAQEPVCVDVELLPLHCLVPQTCAELLRGLITHFLYMRGQIPCVWEDMASMEENPPSSLSRHPRRRRQLRVSNGDRPGHARAHSTCQMLSRCVPNIHLGSPPPGAGV